MINPKPIIKYSFSIIVKLLLLCYAEKLYSQPVSYLGIEQGLSNNTVTSIFKDKHGLMWFGTFDGLSRFDGYGFTKYRNRNGDKGSLPDNYITDIDQDKDGRLFVATKKGLCVLDEKSFRFSTIRFINPQTGNDLLNPSVTSIATAQNGDVYVGTLNSGLMCIKYGEQVAGQIPVKKNKQASSVYSVYNLALDKNDDLWLLSSQGLYRYTTKTKNSLLISAELTSGNSIKFDSNNNAWIGTNSGLFSINPFKKKLIPFPADGFNLSQSRIFDVCFEGKDKLWISTDGDGLILADISSGKVLQRLKQDEDLSLSSNSIYTVFIDKESRKWIGTLRGGVNIIDSKKARFRTIKHEPYNANSIIYNTILSFCEDGNDIWVGTDGGGITVWNRKNNTYKHHVFKTISTYAHGSNQVPSIVKDSNGDIYIATYGAGVKKYNRNTNAFQNIPFSEKSAKYVWRLYLDKSKNLWAGCIKGRWAGSQKTGLFKLDRKTGVFTESAYGLNSEVLSIADDKKGNIWLGTLTGLLKVDTLGRRMKAYNLESFIRSLKFGSDGRLWIGTNGRGLWVLDKQYKNFKSYNEDAGLPNNVVVNIEQDKAGDLWLGTFNGLSRFHVKTSKFENFYVSDGLQSNQFYYNASASLSSGELLFGGIKGFNLFNPERITSYREFPPIVITGMNVLNKPVNASSEYLGEANSIYDVKEIELPYDKSMFSLDFVALEYSLPDKIQYAYYLKGWDKAWNYTQNLHSVNYSRINEGKYTLIIKSTNASGIWNENARLIKIIIFPPWYRSWWAYCIYLILGVVAVYIYIYYQKRQSHLLYEIELAKIKTAQEAELNEKKISFFTNISHELRTPLTLIVNPIKDLLNNDGKNLNIVDISSVYRNTRRMLSLVDQLLLFKSAENEVSDLKPELIDIVEVCTEVFLCFNNQVKEGSINYMFNHNVESAEVFADREKIEIVLFNLLSNAIKFTPKNGTVLLEINAGENEVEIIVKDSGPGIPLNVGDKLFDKFYRLDQVNNASKKSGFGIGLFISKLIAEKQKGSLSYTSKQGQGTTFSYILPKNTIGNQAAKNSAQESKKSHLFDELVAETLNPAKVYGSTVSESMAQVYDDVVSNKPNVLVIDDDGELRNYIRQVLSLNYTIFEAESAEQGLEVLKNAEPDIIVCDVVMPGMGGVEFCSQIKSSKEWGYIPVILLTGTSSPEIKLKGIECGADDYITKPFEKELFLARIKSILKGRDSLKTYFFNEITLQNNNEKVSEEYSLFLKKCIKIVEKHLQDDEFNVGVFVKEMGMSHSNLFRKVKSISGLSISEFIRYLRLKKAAELMIETDIQVKEVAYRVGLQDIRYFREQFSKLFGVNPSDYIKKYRRTFLRAPGGKFAD